MRITNGSTKFSTNSISTLIRRKSSFSRSSTVLSMMSIARRVFATWSSKRSSKQSRRVSRQRMLKLTRSCQRLVLILRLSAWSEARLKKSSSWRMRLSVKFKLNWKRSERPILTWLRLTRESYPSSVFQSKSLVSILSCLLTSDDDLPRHDTSI